MSVEGWKPLCNTKKLKSVLLGGNEKDSSYRARGHALYNWAVPSDYKMELTDN